MTSNQRKGVYISFEMFNTISTIIYLSRIVGFFPITFSKERASYHLVWSRKILTYSYAFTTAIVTLAIYGLTRLYQIEAVAAVRLARTSATICTVLEITWVLLTSIVGTFLTPFFFKHLWHFLDCISKVDLLLGYRHKGNGTLLTLVSLAATLTVLTLDFSLWYKVVAKHTSFLEYSVNVAGLYITYIYLMIREIYFRALVDEIRVRLRYLNQILLDILKEKEIYEYLPTTEEYISKKLVKTVRIKRSSKNHSNHNESVYEKVKKIKIAHSLLAEAATSLNDHQGIFTLVILLGCIIHLLVTPYDLYLLIKGTENHEFIAGQLVWMIGHIFRLVFIIQPCHACKIQIQQTTALICRILTLERCHETTLQLNQLMTQVDKCHVQFSAYDLIEMDRTLLTTVTGTVTTYLVILFQFK